MKNLIFDYIHKRALQTPYWHLPNYMERYWVVPGTGDKPGCEKCAFFRRPVAWALQKMGISIRLHHILSSDDERACHDHPWSFISWILKGAYTEVTPIFTDGLYRGEKRTVRKAGDIYFRRATDWHRLELNEEKSVWTLFVMFRKTQEWGFLTRPDFKTHYRDWHE